MNNHEYKDYILNQSNERRIELLNSSEVRNNLLTNPEYHYSFVWLVQELDELSLKHLLDADFLNQMLKSDVVRLSDKFNAVMTSAKTYVNDFLNNQLFFAYLIKEESIWHYSHSLDLEFAKAFIKYVLENDLEKINIITKFKESVQLDLLDDRLIRQMKSLGVNFRFIKYLQPVAISKLANNSLLLTDILKFYPDELANMASLNINFPLSVQSNEEIINKFINIDNIANYRFMMGKLAVSNQELYGNITRKRNAKYDEYVAKVDVLDETFNKKELVEVLIDRYFEDIAYNFYHNLKEIMNYIDDTKLDLISEEMESIYRVILNFKDYSLNELVDLYKGLNKGVNYAEIFYDDYQRVKNNLYQDINKKIINAKQINTNPSFSKEGVNVLELKGEEFVALGHTSRGLFDNNEPNTTSLSLIGDKHIGFYGNDETIHVGFDELPVDQIMNIHRDDSFSTREYGTDRVNQIRPIEKILEETTFYNEILLYQKTKDTEGDLGPNRKFIRPSYLIALNNISKETIELAKLHNLPVLLIQEDYYINPKNNQRDFDQTYSTEEKIKPF